MRRAVTLIPQGSPSRVQVLVADPPWLFGDKLPRDRGASTRYPCLSFEQLCDFPIPDVGADAILFLWKVEAIAETAYRLAHAWGFTPKAALVWQKLTTNGLDHFGMGRYTRGSHETCIIAARGRAFPDFKGQRSTFRARTPFDEGGKVEHSAKPDEFYAIVERMYPSAIKHELFARTVRPGWQQHGNELGRIPSRQG